MCVALCCAWCRLHLSPINANSPPFPLLTPFPPHPLTPFPFPPDMQASIPIRKAMDPYGDTLLAYEMNGSPLPAAQGYPLRCIAPGVAGVRNVKWVRKIILSAEEAEGPWQRGMAYKGFGPSVTSLEGIDVEAIPSLQEQPVQVRVCVSDAMPCDANECQ